MIGTDAGEDLFLPRLAGTIKVVVQNAHRCIVGNGARVAKVGMVEMGWCQGRYFFSQVRSTWVCQVVKRRKVVKRFQLFGNGIANFLAAMSNVDTPKACHAIKKLFAVLAIDISTTGL